MNDLVTETGVFCVYSAYAVLVSLCGECSAQAIAVAAEGLECFVCTVHTLCWSHCVVNVLLRPLR